jgi:hypothetical protein
VAWNDIAPSGFEAELRHAVLAGIGEAYEENCRRYAPEDLGDNNVSFSHTVRENLRYLVTRNIEDLAARHLGLAGAVEIFWRGPIYEVRLPGNVRLHIYKAPPGTHDVRQLRFDASHRQVEILEVNAEQLAMRFDDVAAEREPELTASTTAGSPSHIVAVHFGDPIGGLHNVAVGEPYLSDLDAPDWVWIESLSEGALLYEREEPQTPEASEEDIDDDFDDLELRDGEAGEDGGEARPGPSGV